MLRGAWEILDGYFWASLTAKRSAHPQVSNNGRVTLNMSFPRFSYCSLPLLTYSTHDATSVCDEFSVSSTYLTIIASSLFYLSSSGLAAYSTALWRAATHSRS